MLERLKYINGAGDAGENVLTYSTYYKQYQQIKNALKLQQGDSVFEVGCGAGANYLFFKDDAIKYGGVDYSRNLIHTFMSIFPDNCIELYCEDAEKFDTEIKYNAVFSMGVFLYFNSLEYATNVLEKMYAKATDCIAVIDVPDLAKKEENLARRRAAIKDYDKKYKDFPRLYFKKEFFEEFAAKYGMEIEFVEIEMPGYWNAGDNINCFMYKK